MDRIGHDLEWCSDYVGRKLKRDEWITDNDFRKATLDNPRDSVYRIIDTCAFFMPKSMQIKWVKEHLRAFTFKDWPRDGRASPQDLSYCNQFIQPSLTRSRFLTEHEFQQMLTNATPKKTLATCHPLIAEPQYERWLEHEAIYWLNHFPRYNRLRSYSRGWH